MIFHDLSHGSTEWFTARVGVATSSCFDKIITPKTGKISGQASGYASVLIAEMVLQMPLEKFPANYWMEWGALKEDEAAAAYEFQTGLTLDRGGFITSDDGKTGASPDRRVRDASGAVIGGLEIKCPAPWTHVDNLRTQAIDRSYYPQVMGQMLLGGFEWVDWFSYHPDMASSRIRTHRDEEYIAALDAALREFVEMVDGEMAKMVERGLLTELPARGKVPVPAEPIDYMAAG